MSNPIFDAIKADIDTNDVVIFMKGEAEQPLCGLLRHCRADF